MGQIGLQQDKTSLINKNHKQKYSQDHAYFQMLKIQNKQRKKKSRTHQEEFRFEQKNLKEDQKKLLDNNLSYLIVNFILKLLIDQQISMQFIFIVNFYIQFKKLQDSAQMSYVPVSEQDKEQQIKKHIEKHFHPIYPGLKYPLARPIHTLQSQIASSVLFQQLIYYNWYYSLLFFYLYAISQIQRLLYFEIDREVPVRIIVGIIFGVMEVCRLRNGHYGNLKQSFPQIFAFLILSFFTITALIILISEIVPASPMQWTILLYEIIFQIVEVIIIIFSMGKLTQAQKALFIWRNPLSYSKK